MSESKQPYLLGLESATQTVEGRAFLVQLFDLSGLFIDPFSPDPSVTAYQAGKQSAARIIFDEMMELQPNTYAKILEDRNNGYY